MLTVICLHTSQIFQSYLHKINPTSSPPPPTPNPKKINFKLACPQIVKEYFPKYSLFFCDIINVLNIGRYIKLRTLLRLYLWFYNVFPFLGFFSQYIGRYQKYRPIYPLKISAKIKLFLIVVLGLDRVYEAKPTKATICLTNLSTLGSPKP